MAEITSQTPDTETAVEPDYGFFTVGNVLNPTWADAEKTQIACQVNFPKHPVLNAISVGFIAIANDPTIHGQLLFANLVAGKYGTILPYVPPPPVVETTSEVE